jgi:hypothetical protein
MPEVEHKIVFGQEIYLVEIFLRAMPLSIVEAAKDASNASADRLDVRNAQLQRGRLHTCTRRSRGT